MVSQIGRLRWIAARWLSLKSTRLDGVRLCADPRTVPYDIRRGLFHRTYEGSERSLLRAALKPGDRVLDVGACTGLLSILCAKIVGAENVLSYEANPALEFLIRDNFGLNRLVPNLRAKAITSDGRDIAFYIHESLFSSSLFNRASSKPISIQSDRFDAVIDEFHPTLIAMDVEGAEDELFASSDLPGVAKIVVELHPHIIGQDRVEAVERRLESLDFTRRSQNRKSAYFARN